MASMADIYAQVKLDLAKQEEDRLRKKIGNIDTKGAGAKVAGRFGVGFNGAFGGIVKHSAGLFVGAFAVVKSAQVFTGFINDARESAKVARLTAQVVASTGGAARISAKAVGELATSISNKTGADDEAIQSGENLLLTFTNVRNAVGKGNDIFNQASRAAVDMAAAMNNGVVDANGLKSANIQLGKALNDPIKGVTALSKVGVSFTAQQKAQIKTLVDSGNTLGAQKIILAEMGKEFGGAATAAADPLTRLKTIAGNLSEQVGGLLLPTVDKFATFLADKGIPGIQAMGAAFQGEGVTSSGFIGVMERIGVAARTAFGFFQTEVLPRLREFGGFIADTIVPKLKEFAGFLVANIVPAVQNLIAAFTPLAKDVGQAAVSVFQKLGPVVLSIGTAIVTTVLPAIRSFTGFLKDNQTLVGAVAVGIGAMVAAFYAYKLALTIVSLATRAYAAVQAALNVVMSLNPIGIVILALIGLAAGLVYAYKKSETFRNIVNGVFNAVKNTAVAVFSAVTGAVKTSIDWVRKNWPLILAILTGPIGVAVLLIARHWDAIKTGARDALAFVVDKFLGFVGTLLTGAAKAFGWVPGMGGKLRGAATEFQKFRNSVNASLRGINDQTITISPIVVAAQQARRNSVANRLGNRPVGMAVGGGVPSWMGVRGKDSVPAMLMPDEHVWTTREVRAAGGHAAVERIRQAALAGELQGFAAGGRVALDVKGRFPKLAPAMGNIVSVAKAVAKPIAQTLANQLASTSGPAGPPGSVTTFRGVRLNQRTITMLLQAERILGRVFHITQGSYSTRVAASGSTHAGGGVMDTNGPGGWTVAQTALRRVGFAAWHRTPAQGPWGHHIHSVAIGDPTASPAAKRQVQAYLRGGDGLGHGMAKGGRVGSLLQQLGIKRYDRGGQWPNNTLGVNTSGKTETVVPGGGAIRLDDDSIRAIGKATGKAIGDATFRLTQSGTNGSYLLQVSNG